MLLSGRWLLIGALALAACGSDATTDDTAADGEVGEDAAEADADADAEEPTDGDDPAGDDRDAEAAPTEPLTGEDGWSELHDVALPEPGNMELTVDGQLFAVEIDCMLDPVKDDEASGSMFLFSLLDSGVHEDGRDFRIMVNRAIAIGGQVDDLYDTGGSSAQVGLTIFGDDGLSTSVVLSPHEDDPGGELLPLVHVSPSGGFTMMGVMEVFDGDDAVAGDAVLAGQCQDGWPDA